jgi:hypothetical protein
MFCIILCVINALVIFIKCQAHHWGWDLQPWKWWLYTGLLTSYLGQTAWRSLEKGFPGWEALVVDTTIHTVVWVVGFMVMYGAETKYVISLVLLALSMAVAFYDPAK